MTRCNLRSIGWILEDKIVGFEKFCMIMIDAKRNGAQDNKHQFRFIIKLCMYTSFGHTVVQVFVLIAFSCNFFFVSELFVNHEIHLYEIRTSAEV